MLFDKSKCTGCGRCRNVTASDAEFVCFSGAKRICGREYTVDEVYDEVAKDMSFYENSDGRSDLFRRRVYASGGIP